MLKVGGAQSVSLSDTNYCGLYRLVWAGLVLTSLNMESSTNFCQPFLFFVPFANQVGGFLPASAIAPFHACRRIMQQIANDCRASFVPSCRDLLGHTTTTTTTPLSQIRRQAKKYVRRIFSSCQQQTLHYTTKHTYKKPNIIETCENSPHTPISFSPVFAPAAREKNEPAGKNNPNKAQFRSNHRLLIFPSQAQATMTVEPISLFSPSRACTQYRAIGHRGTFVNETKLDFCQEI